MGSKRRSAELVGVAQAIACFDDIGRESDRGEIS